MDKIIVESAENANLVTHSGVFHTDEICATALLSAISDVSLFKICRTRDRHALNQARGNFDTVVVDVGGEYSPMSNKFDHHQGGELPKYENAIPYSSFGMVFEKYGEDYITTVLRHNYPNIYFGTDTVDKVLEKFTEEVVQPIDAWDNGVKGTQRPAIVEILSAYNPSWANEAVNAESYGFLAALQVASEYIANKVISIAGIVFAEVHVNVAYHRNGMVVLDRFVPWQAYAWEEDLVFVFPNKDKNWTVQCCPVASGSRDLKVTHPKGWAHELPQDAIFVHKGLFLSVWKSKEAAIAAAKAIVATHNPDVLV